MAERSKAVDSRPTLFGVAGSNPASVKLPLNTANLMVKSRSFKPVMEVRILRGVFSSHSVAVITLVFETRNLSSNLSGN